ncbi:MAG: hypothetical protein Fur0037_22540 [Planctomycetota bacterium]
MSPSTTTRWAAVWIALAVVLLARATARDATKGVLLDHLEFGRRLVRGEDVYAPWRSDPDAPPRPLHAPYPPSFGLLTAPFAGIAAAAGLPAARFCWALLQIGCLALAALALRACLGPRAPPPAQWHWLCMLAALLGSRFVLRDTHGGGGNIVNLGLALAAFAEAERRRFRMSGLWLGLSLATKPTMVWLLPLLAVLGHVRAAVAAVAVAAALAAVAAAFSGFDPAPWHRWVAGSLALATQPDPFAAPALGFPEFEWMNQSLRLAVHRWIATVPPDLAGRVRLGLIPGLGASIEVATWTHRALSLALLALLFARAWSGRADPSLRPRALAAALVLSVLLSPLSWKAHHVALLPALLLLLLDAKKRPRIGILLILWAIVCVPGRDLIGDDAEEWLNSVYAVTAWDLALFAALLRPVRDSAAVARRDPIG